MKASYMGSMENTHTARPGNGPPRHPKALLEVTERHHHRPNPILAQGIDRDRQCYGRVDSA